MANAISVKSSQSKIRSTWKEISLGSASFIVFLLLNLTMIQERSVKALKFIVNRILQNQIENAIYSVSTKTLKNCILYKFIFNEISSTMKISEQWPKQEVQGYQIYMFRALSQRNGKGQNSNVWNSPKGNLYMTVLFKCNIDKLGFLSMIGMISICKALKKIDEKLQLKIKWINDVFLYDKKVCGILTKSSIIGEQAYCQLGIGLNIFQAPIQTSTCLNQYVKGKVQTEQISQMIVEEILEALKLTEEEIVSEYQKWLLFLNEEVVIMDESLKQVLYKGIFAGVDKNGFARLQGLQAISKGRMRKYQTPKQIFVSFLQSQKKKKNIL